MKRKRIVFGMEQQTIRIWMGTNHPTTIINDRYNGIYSGALWLAFPLEHYEAPREADGCYRACVSFWDEYREPVGKGGSPEEAFENLTLDFDKAETALRLFADYDNVPTALQERAQAAEAKLEELLKQLAQ